ncbi:hypothetical protein [Vibrio crassostreae]|uniref:hypothetical protein n=1 Tax=Vibrio crassostreae TaxID=246167 RepID=UPI001B3166E8|nr:hypothetical protein [Vibrio crassostreae]
MELHKETKLKKTLREKALNWLDGEKLMRGIVTGAAGFAFKKAIEGTKVEQVFKAGEKAVKDVTAIGKDIGTATAKKVVKGEVRDMDDVIEIKNEAVQKFQKMEGVKFSDASTQSVTPKGSSDGTNINNPARILGDNEAGSTAQKNELSPFSMGFLNSINEGTQISAEQNPNLSVLTNDLATFDISQYSIAAKLNLEQTPSGYLTDNGMSKGMSMFDLTTLNTTAKITKPTEEFHFSIGYDNQYDHSNVMKAEAVSQDVGVYLVIATGVAVMAAGKAVKDVPFGKLIQRERHLTEVTSNEEFRKNLMALADLPIKTEQSEIGKSVNRLVFDDEGIANMEDWMVILDNFKDTHIKRSLVRHLPFGNKNTRTPEQLELISDTQKLLLTYIAESKRDDNVSKKVTDSIKHSVAIAEVIVDEYKRDPKAFKTNHKEVYNTIFKAIPSNRTADKTKMFFGMDKNDLFFKGRVVSEVAKKLSNIKSRKRDNGVKQSYVQFGKELEGMLLSVENPSQEKKDAKKAIFVVNNYIKDANNPAKKKKNSMGARP